MNLLLVPLLFYCALIILDAVVSRLVPVNRIASFIAVAIPLGVALIAYLTATATTIDIVLSLTMLFALLCEIYVFLFTLTLGSISVNLLVLLKDGAMSLVQLRSIYEGDLMTRRRIERLQNTGLILRGKNGWVLTRRGEMVLCAFRQLRTFFLHPGD